MARPLKENEYNARRDEILDMARRLIYTKGYEQMTIQDLLDGLHISKGGLYHYFASKEALLAALVERMGQDAAQTLQLIVQDANLTAIQKFRRILETSAQGKTSQKELISSFMRLWYSQENAMIRQKMEVESRKHMSALYEPIIRQGNAEGTFTVRYPKQTAMIIAGISLILSDRIIELLLSPQIDQAAVKELQDTLEAYVDSIERILGAPAGSLHAFAPGAFDEWMKKTEQTYP